MLALFSTIFGFISSAVIPLIKMWTDKSQAKSDLELENARHAHELELTELQAKLQVQLQGAKLEETQVNAQSQQYLAEIQQNTAAIQNQESFAKANSVVNFLSGIIRPLSTLSSHLIFSTLLVLYVVMGLTHFGTSLQGIQAIMSNPFVDGMYTIYAGMMGFWFGNRTVMQHYGK